MSVCLQTSLRDGEQCDTQTWWISVPSSQNDCLLALHLSLLLVYIVYLFIYFMYCLQLYNCNDRGHRPILLFPLLHGTGCTDLVNGRPQSTSDCTDKKKKMNPRHWDGKNTDQCLSRQIYLDCLQKTINPNCRSVETVCSILFSAILSSPPLTYYAIFSKDVGSASVSTGSHFKSFLHASDLNLGGILFHFV